MRPKKNINYTSGKIRKKNNPRKSYIQIFKFSKIETSDIMQQYSERAARDFHNELMRIFMDPITLVKVA